MQIHVEVDAQNETRIKIFSKSRRESTWDRFATHWYVDWLQGYNLLTMSVQDHMWSTGSFSEKEKHRSAETASACPAGSYNIDHPWSRDGSIRKRSWRRWYVMSIKIGLLLTCWELARILAHSRTHRDDCIWRTGKSCPGHWKVLV